MLQESFTQKVLRQLVRQQVEAAPLRRPLERARVRVRQPHCALTSQNAPERAVLRLLAAPARPPAAPARQVHVTEPIEYVAQAARVERPSVLPLRLEH